MNANSPWLELFRKERRAESRRRKREQARPFIHDGETYVVKQVQSKGCKGCAFEHEEAVRRAACRICLNRIATIYVKEQI